MKKAHPESSILDIYAISTLRFFYSHAFMEPESANVGVANAQMVERVENVSFYRAYLMPIKHLG